MPKRKKINPLIYLICSIFAGVFVGLVCRELPYDIRYTVSEIVVVPLFDTFIGLLIATALPMMFLSLIWGIYSIGDTATLGNIGKRVIGRYLGRIYFTLVICTLVCVPFFEYAAGGTTVSGGEFTAIFFHDPGYYSLQSHLPVCRRELSPNHLSRSDVWSCHAYSEQKDPGDHTVRRAG